MRNCHRTNSPLLTMMLPVVALVLFTFVCLSQVAGAAPDHNRTLIGINKKPMNNPVVVMETNKGVIKVQIYEAEAPITSHNFLDLVKRGFYNGLGFHRYEPGFVIQGGDPKGTGTGGFIDPTTKKERNIPLEVKPNLKHEAGAIAMARTNDPNSASSQFYFTLAATPFLDMQYAVFGKVIDGMKVVESLRAGDKMTKVTVMEPAVK
ncbi:MAG: peptidylprolyl isomerase [Candidatus Obscuribacterales bacterium]|nr:peptidylprolyl isomerase [Candidatus Obscuribacterales bacterium]